MQHVATAAQLTTFARRFKLLRCQWGTIQYSHTYLYLCMCVCMYVLVYLLYIYLSKLTTYSLYANCRADVILVAGSSSSSFRLTHRHTDKTCICVCVCVSTFASLSGNVCLAWSGLGSGLCCTTCRGYGRSTACLRGIRVRVVPSATARVSSCWLCWQHYVMSNNNVI